MGDAKAITPQACMLAAAGGEAVEYLVLYLPQQRPVNGVYME
jgi:hypothetical protein